MMIVLFAYTIDTYYTKQVSIKGRRPIAHNWDWLVGQGRLLLVGLLVILVAYLQDKPIKITDKIHSVAAGTFCGGGCVAPSLIGHPVAKLRWPSPII